MPPLPPYPLHKIHEIYVLKNRYAFASYLRHAKYPGEYLRPKQAYARSYTNVHYALRLSI